MSCGWIELTPSSVEMEIASSEPITTTNRIAASERPNHKIARGSQQMDGSACKPITSGLSVMRRNEDRAMPIPSGTPIDTEIKYPCIKRSMERTAARSEERRVGKE